MTTAQAIEGITDAGNFEILATRVLRLVDSDCKSLEHLGVNAEGKTIKGPVDGFCKVPGSSPARFVMSAFATDTAEKLERKWIYDHSKAQRAKKAKPADDGDLIKAGRRAESLRNSNPGASFVVWLCTNKQPNDDLMATVLTKGNELGIEVRFLGRSRLRDTLDATPEGQWLRKEHLGIEAELVSFSLLRNLASKSLERYSREFLVTTPESFVETESMRALTAAVEEHRSVYVVSGSSGSGKSVTCFQILKNQFAEGNLAIWINGRVAAESNSLEEAIGATLQSLHPSIAKTAGFDALEIAERSRRLILVIDDIVRGGTPAETLQKILSWRAPMESGNSERPAHSIIVPTWDLFWAPYENQLRSASWIARLASSRLNEDEASLCLAAALGSRSVLIDESRKRRLVNALAFDPILIALYAASADLEGRINDPSLPNEVIGEFISLSVSEVAASSDYNTIDLESALARLADWMLSNRELYPRWETLGEGLPDNVVGALSVLSQRGKICRVATLQDGGQFGFRHDRLLEFLLAKGIQRKLADLSRNWEVFADPFFAGYLGCALATETSPQETIDCMETRAPLALLEALKYISDSPSEHPIAIVDAATRWVRFIYQDRASLPAIRFEASRVLEQTDSHHVLRITEGVYGDRLIARARFANGCAREILQEFSDPHWFSPAITDRSLDTVLQRGIRSHRKSLVEQCARFLMDDGMSDDLKRGALVLAGYLSDDSLNEAIEVAWTTIDDKGNAILSAIWAELRCPRSGSEVDVGPIIAAWAELPNDDIEGGRSERIDVASQLDFAIRRGIPIVSVDRLIRVARDIEELRWPITVALEHSDVPQAIVFLLGQAARIQKKVNETGGFSHFIFNLKQEWDPSSASRGRRLPASAVEAIRGCWDSKLEADEMREVAFECWISAVDDLAVLQKVLAEHPQFQSVLWRRASLGDLSAVSQFVQILESDPHWFRIAQRVWCPAIREQAEKAISLLASETPLDYSGGRTNQHYALAELLRDIPASDAELMLLENWEGLQFSPLFVQVALYIGSSECLKAAHEAIDRYPSPNEAFTHIGSIFGFFTTGLVDRLERRHLDVLLPYIRFLDEHALSSMAEYCRRHGQREWAIRYLSDEFNRRNREGAFSQEQKKDYCKRMARHHFPSDEELLEDLDKMAESPRHIEWEAHRWSEQFQERGDDHSRWRRLLRTWLSKGVSVDRVEVVSAALIAKGNRSDLDLVAEISVEGSAAAVAMLRDNATFAVKRRSIC